MTLTLYGLKNCDTCKKAMKSLSEQNATFVDIRAETDLATKVPQWIAAVGAEKLVNKRSTTWRDLDDAEKGKVESDDIEDLLVAKPTLIKRPVIERGDEVFVGWTKDVADALS
ncbi:MAG: ArsC/Spx/MgsR family protein [Pseudomonadota bacterium]